MRRVFCYTSPLSADYMGNVIKFVHKTLNHL